MGIYVILGSTGKVGVSTVRELRRAGQDVLAVVRSTTQAPTLERLGCRMVQADLDDADSLAACFHGADGVQVICPPDPRSDDPLAAMARYSANLAQALRMARPRRVVAISDYGAHLDRGSGITLGFHDLESRLADVGIPVTFLRSAEHMENWKRSFPAVLRTGTLPSMHHPLSKAFPTVSATDLGRISALQLLSPVQSAAKVIHVEGPRRYTALDVAEVLQSLAGKPVSALEAPQETWVSRLQEGGMSPQYARLLEELYETHNRGGIGVEPGGEVLQGTTSLTEALAEVWKPSL